MSRIWSKCFLAEVGYLFQAREFLFSPNFIILLVSPPVKAQNITKKQSLNLDCGFWAVLVWMLIQGDGVRPCLWYHYGWLHGLDADLGMVGCVNYTWTNGHFHLILLSQGQMYHIFWTHYILCIFYKQNFAPKFKRKKVLKTEVFRSADLTRPAHRFFFVLKGFSETSGNPEKCNNFFVSGMKHGNFNSFRIAQIWLASDVSSNVAL